MDWNKLDRHTNKKRLNLIFSRMVKHFAKLHTCINLHQGLPWQFQAVASALGKYTLFPPSMHLIVKFLVLITNEYNELLVFFSSVIALLEQFICNLSVSYFWYVKVCKTRLKQSTPTSDTGISTSYSASINCLSTFYW